MTIPIVALDVPGVVDARRLLEVLGDSCDFYKVGGELFTAAGPRVVEEVRRAGKRVFLDLKFFDIPNTVRAAARSAAEIGASLLTVHATGGSTMVEAAVEGAGQECGVLAVTVLTSYSRETLGLALGRAVDSVGAEVLRLAGLARNAGAHGVVCSGHEVAEIRAVHGTALATLVPGVRLSGDAVHDQARVVTPGTAARSGATYVVLGRTVTASSDPLAAMMRVRSEIGDALG